MSRERTQQWGGRQRTGQTGVGDGDDLNLTISTSVAAHTTPFHTWLHLSCSTWSKENVLMSPGEGLQRNCTVSLEIISVHCAVMLGVVGRSLRTTLLVDVASWV